MRKCILPLGTRMKKDCLGCKAHYASKYTYTCHLDYKIDGYTPLEICPKPRTYKSFVRYNQERLH